MAEKLGNNYPNPLDNFRSYSYHFILTAASTTEAFRKMIGEGDSGRSYLSAISSKSLGDSFKVGGQTAYLLVDTRRFSQYTITGVEMEHVYGTGPIQNPTVPVASTVVKLLDSTGLSFFDFMMDMFRNKMQTSALSAFFLLTIMFVGHKDDGTTETISTCHIPLVLLLMSFTFTHRGSEFDIEFMELEGAAARKGPLSQLNYVGKITTVSTKEKGANTVGELVDDLEQQLNKQSLAYYQKYTNDAFKSGADKKKLGKLVQYMITVPEDPKQNWKEFKVTNANRSVNTEQMPLASTAESSAGESKAAEQPAGENKSKYSTISFSNTTPISDVIKMILESSEEYMALASTEKRKSGTAIASKTVISITSDDTSYVVHFDVYPHFLPKTTDDGKIVAGSSSKNVIGSAGAVKNLITYDYIYTGKNSHILDLKIEYGPESAIALDTDLELGKARFNSNANAGQNSSKVNKESVGAPKTKSFSPQIRPGDPIFIPMPTKDEMNNNSSQFNEELGNDKSKNAFKVRQEYNQTYASLHFLSSINLDMTIRGNPNIIRKFADRPTRGGFQPHDAIVSEQTLNAFVSKGQQEADSTFIKSVESGIISSKQKYIKSYVQPRIEAYSKTNKGNDSLLNNIDISVSPLFIKLNLLAPNVDWAGSFKEGQPMFTNKFFFNGPYQCLFIKTSFSSGDFSHSLSMIPYDISGDYITSGDSQKTKG